MTIGGVPLSVRLPTDSPHAVQRLLAQTIPVWQPSSAVQFPPAAIRGPQTPQSPCFEQ